MSHESQAGPPPVPSGWSRRHVVLLALAGWAAILSLETLFRSPGVPTGMALPQRLTRQGMLYVRRQAPSRSASLPAGLTLLEAADFHPLPSHGWRQPLSPIRLRLIGLASSGTGVHMPVEAIAPAILGPQGRGACVALHESGEVSRTMATAAQWNQWMASSRPGPDEMVLWLAGLRPYRANVCLWEGLP